MIGFLVGVAEDTGEAVSSFWRSFFFLQFSRSALAVACFSLLLLLLPLKVLRRWGLGLCKSGYEKVVRTIASLAVASLWIIFTLATFRPERLPSWVLASINLLFAVTILSVIGLIKLKDEENKNMRRASLAIQELMMEDHTQPADLATIEQLLVDRVNAATLDTAEEVTRPL